MPEIVAVPAPQATDVWVVENHQLEYLGLEPQPPVEIIVVHQIEAIALVDTGKGDQGIQGIPGPMGDSTIHFSLDYDVEPRVGAQSYRFAFAATLAGVSACMRLPGTGGDCVIDVNVNGVSIFPDQGPLPTPDDRPRLASGVDDLPEIVLDVPIVSGDRLSIDVDDTGSTFGGEDLSVFIRFERV